MSRLKLTSDTTDTNLLHPDYYLPSEVIDSLLVCLPIKDAVRTSVLSSKWMFKWHSMSKLVFNFRCLQQSLTGEEHAVELNKLADIIDGVLSLHVGPIESFEILSDLPNSHDMSRWIIILWRNHIKKLTLQFMDVNQCIPSSRLLNCAELTHLELYNCQLTPSSCFSKLVNLEHLVLGEIGGPSSVLKSLICSSPLLKYLSLATIEVPMQLDIQALNLQEVDINCTYCVINIVDAPRLTKLTIDLEETFLEREGQIRIANFLASLFKLESLMLYNCSLQWLFGYGEKLDRLPATYLYMNKFHVAIDFCEKEDVMALLSLLKSFPNLKALLVDNRHTGNERVWEVGDESLTFSHLEMMGMTNIIGLSQELHILKNILANAPVLETLVLSIDPKKNVTDKYNMLKELLQYRRASAQAEIIIDDRNEI